MVKTNFDPADLPNAIGLHIPLDTHRYDVARMVAQEIIDVSDGIWQEVTDDAPTPAFLQGYASTIDLSGSDTPTTNGSETAYITLYHANDAGLAAGTPYCNLLRVWVGTRGVSFSILDTRGSLTGWRNLYMTSGNQTLGTSGANAWVLPNTTAMGTTTPITSTTFDNISTNSRFLLFVSNDFLITAFYHTPTETINGNAFIVYQPFPSDGHMLEEFHARILDFNIGDNISGTATLAAGPACLGLAASSGTTATGSEQNRRAQMHGIRSITSWTADTEEIFMPMVMTSDFRQENIERAFFWGALRNVRHVRSGVTARWQVIGIGGVDWVNIGEFFDSRSVLVPLNANVD